MHPVSTEQHTQISDLAVLYPGTMAAGITAWLTAARAAGYEPHVLWREDGTGEDGLAVVDLYDEDGEWVRLYTRTYARYEISLGRDGKPTRVYETIPSDGTHAWRYTPVWAGLIQEMPTRYRESAGVPYLVVPSSVEDDYELYVLRTPDGTRRANVVSGMPADFAAWTLGALHLDEYELDYYNIHGDLRRAVGDPETAAELSEGVAHWEAKDQAFREQWPEFFA